MDGVWGTITEGLLSDMRLHVRNLQERVAEANDVLQQSESVNEKIHVMREFKDEVTVNSCFHGKDRVGLVRSLQHENRQILALQEENRQMKLALEDVQRGMTLIMEKHRAAVRNFERSNALFELVQRRYDASQKNNAYERRFYELADFSDALIKQMADQHSKDAEQFAAVCSENAYLRQTLLSKGAELPGVPRRVLIEGSRRPAHIPTIAAVSQQPRREEIATPEAHNDQSSTDEAIEGQMADESKSPKEADSQEATAKNAHSDPIASNETDAT